MMKRFAGLAAVAALGLGLTLAGGTAKAQLPGSSVVVDLIAGQYTKVGTVTAVYNAGNVQVTYQITQGTWKIEEVHLAVGDNLSDIPQRNGNPNPGNFPYKAVLNKATSYTFNVPFQCPSDHEIIVASHAVVDGTGGTLVVPDSGPATVEEWYATLPTIGGTYVEYQLPGDPAYLLVTVTAGSVSGTYEGWCVDAEYGIPEGVSFDAGVICSYDPRAQFLVPKGENWALINWLLNQDFVGAASPTRLGRYTMGDVQKAIWSIVDTTTSENFVDPYNPARVAELVAAAYANGVGFYPGIDQKVVMIAVPTNLSTGFNVAQTHIFAVPWNVSGGGGGGGKKGGGTPGLVSGNQTAWGGVTAFPGDNWGFYFPLRCRD